MPLLTLLADGDQTLNASTHFTAGLHACVRACVRNIGLTLWLHMISVVCNHCLRFTFYNISVVVVVATAAAALAAAASLPLLLLF